jgi:DNA-directed RNA polymerase specialized sigma24 family protein
MTPGILLPEAKTRQTLSAQGHPQKAASGSVTDLIRLVKKGDSAAAQELFVRYARRLLGLAHAQLRGKNLRIADEEDVVNIALADFFLGAERGQYSKLHDREDLWHLLVKITVRKAQRLLREQRSRKRCPRGLGQGTPSLDLASTPADVPVQQIADRKPPPDLEVLGNETFEHLLNRLGNAHLRAIAVWKWEAYSNKEIAAMLGCCARTIARKLELIRTIWSHEETR